MIFPGNIYSFLNSPEDYLLKLQKKHGDPFPFSLGMTKTTWMTGDPELAKKVFNALPDSFKPAEDNPVGPLLGKEGLIMQGGPLHLKNRKMFSPYFSKNNLLPFAKTIADIFFENFKNTKEQGKLSIQDFSLNLTLKIIIKFIFPHLNQVETNEAINLTEDFLKNYSAFYLFVPSWLPFTWSKFNHTKKKLDEKFYQFYQTGISEGPLSTLTELQKSEILDHIRTFIVAGHETSATALTWALYYIHKNQDVFKKLHQELSVNDNLSEDIFLEKILTNTYLDLIIQETLRVHPPVPFVTRQIINRPFIFGNKTLNIDDQLGVCLFLLHHQATTSGHPSTFTPERFLTKKQTPFEYAPFGGGTRKCIGAEFAILELKILIGLFVKFYQAELIDRHCPQPQIMQITAGPKKPIFLRYSKNI